MFIFKNFRDRIMGEIGGFMIQVLKMSDFKNQNKIMNEMDIYALLYSFGLNGQLVNNIDIKTIFNYMNGERKIIVSILMCILFIPKINLNLVLVILYILVLCNVYWMM